MINFDQIQTEDRSKSGDRKIGKNNVLFFIRTRLKFLNVFIRKVVIKYNKKYHYTG